MKFLLAIIFTLSFATQSFAAAMSNPDEIVCDKDARRVAPRNRKLTRVTFKRIGTTEYEMIVEKEKGCANPGCSYLVEVFRTYVDLFESPLGGTLVTPNRSQFGKNDDISIELEKNGKCQVKLPRKDFRFRGRFINYES